MTLNEYRDHVHANATAHGWYEQPNPNIPEKLMLVVSEVSEALEEYRNGRLDTWQGEGGKPEGFGIELIDALIRILDLAGHLKLDVDGLFWAKHEFNRGRPYRHGGKVA